MTRPDDDSPRLAINDPETLRKAARIFRQGLLRQQLKRAAAAVPDTPPAVTYPVCQECGQRPPVYDGLCAVCYRAQDSPPGG